MPSQEKIQALEHRMLSLGITDDTLLEKFICGSGHGGQKINKTASCVYLKHLPSGVEVKCQQQRSRELNRHIARRELCERLEEIRDGQKEKRQQAYEKTRRQKRRRSQRAKNRMLDDKTKHATKKKLRKPPGANDQSLNLFMKTKKQTSLIVITLILFAVVSFFITSKNTDTPHPSPKNKVSHHLTQTTASDTSITTSHQTSARPHTDLDKTIQPFKSWVNGIRGKRVIDPDTIRKGVSLATARRSAMISLMKEDPEKSLRHAISWADYKMLPKEVQSLVETPFSQRGDFLVFPSCGNPKHTPTYLVDLGQSHFKTTAFGRRKNLTSKQNTPLQGIYLDGVAAIRSTPLQILSPEDALAIKDDFPIANQDITRGFASGKKITSEPVIALGGGKLFYFSNKEEVDKTNKKLSKLDELPGPHAGAQAIFILASGGSGENSSSQIVWSALESDAKLESKSWTESKKKVFFIRIDFSDKPGASVTQARLKDVLNNAVSNTIRDMSYGKTWIEADVSSVVVRVPRASTIYSPDNSFLLHTDAVAAFKLLNTGINLDDYDIVGLHFKNIKMNYGGSAIIGGNRLWIQNSTSTQTITHELGHNYGLHHAHFWKTTDGSAIGPATTVEYGNLFDIMGSGPAPEGHFHPQAKHRLSWLGTNDWADVSKSGSGTYRVYRCDDKNTTGIRALRIDKNLTTAYEYFWIGYRRAFKNNKHLQHGVILNWEKSRISWLVDTTPGSPAEKDDSSITIGRTFSDTTTGIHITPIAQGGTAPNEWIDVTVNLGSFPGNTPPTASLTGPTTGDARKSLTFTASATDPDGDTLAYSWDFGDGSVVVNNQSSATHQWIIKGTYTVKVTVSDMKGGTVTKTQTITINEPLTNWTQRTSGTSNNLKDIALGGGKLVAVGSKGTYRISTDATTWTGGSLGNNISLNGITYDGSQFLCCGYDSSARLGVIYTSPDGSTWTRRHTVSNKQLRDICYGNGIYLATGDYGTVRRSTDGITWTSVSPGIYTHLYGVSYGNGGFVIAGNKNLNQGVTILKSTDGLTWENTTSGAGVTQRYSGFYHLEFTHDRFLASGYNTKLRHSTDGGTTFHSKQPSYTYYNTPGMTYGNNIYFAAGIDQNNNDINLLSSDGEHWISISTTSQENRNAAIFFKNSFITVGNEGSIWQSAPITTLTGWQTWQAQEFPDSPVNSGAYDDYDHDGVSNLIEYITGSDPQSSSSYTLPTLAEESGYITMTIQKAAGVNGFSLVIETSEDLQTWSTANLVTITDDASMLKVRLDTPISSTSAKKIFFRASAVITP